MATLKELRDVRIQKLNKLKELGVNPYPAKTAKNTNNNEIAEEFSTLENKQVTVAGRIISIRGHGKLSFIDIKDATGVVQLYTRETNLMRPDYKNGYLAYSDLELLDMGDFLEATGLVVKTKSGEISVEPTKLRLLTKSLRPMPDMWDGLKDKETRMRRRYLDTNINKEVYERYIRRAKFWEAHRDFLKKHGFMEMNIPVLENIPGGADANPFITHMDAVDQDFYLRISQELYLKRLVGGGYERVFEIGPRFRNEGWSDEHLPEHMAMEFYWAYASWEEGMELVKGLFNHVLDYVYNGQKKFSIRGHEVDFSTDWEVIDFAKIMKEKFGFDVHNTNVEEVSKACEKHGVKGEFEMNVHRGIDNLWKLIRKEITGPAFLINHPKYLSPLAKAHAEFPHITERFQPIIAGSELGNGWSEINDPIDQLDRFLEQQDLRDAGDSEAQWLDIDYVEMLEYGMPPTFGYGHSERVFWFLENVTAREGVPFPQLKHEMDSVTKDIYGIKDVPKLSSKKSSSPSEAKSTYTISGDLLKDFPGLSYAYVVINNVNVVKKDDSLENLKASVVSEISQKDLNSAVSEGPIAAYRMLFKETGTDYHSKKPSPEALLTRVTKGKGLYTINTAVDAYNLAVLETHVGLGGFDLDTIEGSIVLRYSKDGEKIHLLGDSGLTTTRDRQIVYADQKSPITLDLNYRDIDRTKITEETKRIVLFADGAPGIASSVVLNALEKGARYIQKYCGGVIESPIYVSESNSQSKNIGKLPTREESLALLEKYVADEYQKHHAKMVASAMEAYAQELGEDPELWYITGLLHDLDYFMHPDEHPSVSLTWFNEWGYPEELSHAVAAHAHDRLGVEPETPLAAALCAVDEMSGFLYAYSLMRPTGFEGMDPKSVKKKFKDKAFAAKISREDIMYGLEKFQKDLEEHVAFLIKVFSR